MSVVVLDENRWQNILAFLKTADRVNIWLRYGKEAGCKRFGFGAPWHYLPETYGK